MKKITPLVRYSTVPHSKNICIKVSSGTGNVPFSTQNVQPLGWLGTKWESLVFIPKMLLKNLKRNTFERLVKPWAFQKEITDPYCLSPGNAVPETSKKFSVTFWLYSSNYFLFFLTNAVLIFLPVFLAIRIWQESTCWIRYFSRWVLIF